MDRSGALMPGKNAGMAAHGQLETTVIVGFAVLIALLAFGMAFSIRRLQAVADAQIDRTHAEEDEITLVEQLRWKSEVIVSDGTRVPHLRRPRASLQGPGGHAWVQRDYQCPSPATPQRS